MDREFKTTFIPKKRIAEKSAPKKLLSSANSSLLGMLSLLLFVTALIATVGVFFYKYQVHSRNQVMKQSINKTNDSFEPAVILELKKLDIRLRAANDLLDKHVAISDFFESFAESTMPSVAFSDFSFEFDNEAPRVSMSGEAKTYLAIAQQSQIFEDNRYIQNHIFSDFSLTDNGHVNFALEFTINRDLLSYGRIQENNDVEGVNSGNLIVPDSSTTKANDGLDINFN